MLKNRFNPTLPLLVVLYLRMSSDQQNPRSPQQQRETIEGTFKRLGYPWTVVKSYTDEAVSGRLLRRRRGFQDMLRDIRTGTIQVDAILVDTFERFGRADELAELRRSLHQRHGVLVLTADTQFCDPTSISGKALAAFESLRATEDNRIKAHNVLRGKRDAARRGHWPGGLPPFGYKLQSVLTDRNGRQEVDHCVLVPDPETSWIVKALFDAAITNGFGSTRLAQMFNSDSTVPSKHKPIYANTVDYWLQHPIYYGELVWEEHATGIVDDRRVVEQNPDEDVIRVPAFCEPLVSRQTWDAVQEARRVRGEHIRLARQAKRISGGKQVAAVIPGLAVKYILSGLVRCGHCQRSMTVSSTTYAARSGEIKRYASYGCQGYVTGVCPNKTRVSEPWIRNVVAWIIGQRLFPSQDGTFFGPLAIRAQSSNHTKGMPDRNVHDAQKEMWFPSLVKQITLELAALGADRRDMRPFLKTVLAQVLKQIQGWSLSLANPDLDSTLRTKLEMDLKAVLIRQQQIERKLIEADALRRPATTVEPHHVVDRLSSLGDVLGRWNPTRSNLELSLHIDHIRCYQDGRVIVRTCKIGALAGCTERKSAKGEVKSSSKLAAIAARPRRRSVRRVTDSGEDDATLQASAHRAADVNRFAGLGNEWFWEDEFTIPEATCWSREHAEEVGRLRQEGVTHEKLAAHFKVTTPTIRNALSIWRSLHPASATVPRKMPRRRWEDEHAQEVLRLRRLGQNLSGLAAHFGKSLETIRKSLRLAERQENATTSIPPQDGEP